ncbi:MAG: hypothetical protein VB977_08290 [Pseudohongiellaceae bacterium]|jgi:hypothetical protein
MSAPDSDPGGGYSPRLGLLRKSQLDGSGSELAVTLTTARGPMFATSKRRPGLP